MQIYDLKTEYRKNPIGIDMKHPRLSWKIRSEKRNVVQTAYRILAYGDENEEELIWDSGIVQNGDSQRVCWAGPDLTSEQRVYWKVRVSAGEEKAESEFAFFEMGLLSADDWKAEWIEPEGDIDYYSFQPAPYLRKSFYVKKGLKKARIYQTAHGLYEFWLNGSCGTDEKFKPGYTSYTKRIQYQTYDITSLLKPGENVWSVALGDGWWRGIIGGTSRNNWGYRLHLYGQIILTYEDGSREYVITDEKFRTSYGAVRMADMKAGEIFQADLEPVGWKEPGFDDTSWKNVHLADRTLFGDAELIPSRSVPVREKETFIPKIFTDAEGNTVLDFGQNIAGYVKVKFHDLKKGQQIRLLHGEDIKDGVFSIENLGGDVFMKERFQQIDYIAKGGETTEYCPLFSVFGFRYVKVSGYDGDILPEDFTAVAVYSDLEETGDFECSNPLINQLVSNSRWSQKGNYLEVPTDCPTRERSPWTGDSQVYCRTAADFMNVYPFFEKWMLDFNCDQLKSGKLRSLVPYGSRNAEENRRAKERFFKSLEGKTEYSVTDQMMLMMYQDESEESGVADGSAGWSDACVINPYTMYLCYGDQKILENQYESAKKHVEYMFSKAKNKNEHRTQEPEYHTYTDGELDADYIWDTEFHWGEWLEADIGTEGEMQGMIRKFTDPDPEVPTAFMCYSTRLVSKMAKILGKSEEAEYYRKKSDKVKSMFNKYLIRPDGTIKEGRQAPNVRALAFDLCDSEQREKVADRLEEMIENNDYHLNTGFLATPYILDVLTDTGHTDTAFRLLEQETEPSWLYNVKKGATTILEEWNGMETHRGSFNHYSYGSVCNYLFSRVAGICPSEDDPGYKKIIIHPVIGGTLTRAKCRYESIYGTIRSEWMKEGEKMRYLFEIPVNTTAIIRLDSDEKAADKIKMQYPDAVFRDRLAEFTVGSGKWEAII